MFWIFVWFFFFVHFLFGFFLCPPISARSWVSLAWGMVFCRSLLPAWALLLLWLRSRRERKWEHKIHLLVSREWAHPSVLTEKENMGLWKAAKLFLGELGKAIRNTSGSHNSLECVSPNTGIRITEATQKAVCHYFPIPTFLPLTDSTNFIALSQRRECRAVEVALWGSLLSLWWWHCPSCGSLP